MCLLLIYDTTCFTLFVMTLLLMCALTACLNKLSCHNLDTYYIFQLLFHIIDVKIEEPLLFS